jgi:hypothetical protein
MSGPASGGSLTVGAPTAMIFIARIATEALGGSGGGGAISRMGGAAGSGATGSLAGC